MTVKVYRKGKGVEVYKETNNVSTINEEEVNSINEAEEEAKEFEEEMKIQMEMEKLKQENPEKYMELVKKDKSDKIKSIIFLIWFFTSIILMFVFSSLGKGALTLSVFGHYFAVFGFMAFMSADKPIKLKEEFVPILFMIFGLSFMIGCILYQFGILSF